MKYITPDNTPYRFVEINVEPCTKVLDIGCSSGIICKVLNNKGCSVVGLDINPITTTEALPYCNEIIVVILKL